MEFPQKGKINCASSFVHVNLHAQKHAQNYRHTTAQFTFTKIPQLPSQPNPACNLPNFRKRAEEIVLENKLDYALLSVLVK